MRNALLCLVGLSVFMCSCGKPPPPAAKVFSWAQIKIAPAKEGPDNSYVVSVYHGKKTGQWRLTAQSNVNPETQTKVGANSLPVPETGYGWRYFLYETEDGNVLLHVYLPDVQEVNSPSEGKATYKRDDVKDELIGKFKEISQWTILSNRPDADDGK